MLKKNEVLEILENGGHISINEVYRSAAVYSLGGDNLGTCRYDTAERIGKQDGYTDKRLGAWSFTRHIEKTNIPAEMIAAQEENEPAQEAAQNEEENEMNENNLTNQQPNEIEQDEQQPLDELDLVPVYLNENVPSSNRIDGVQYRVRYSAGDCIGCKHLYTVDDVQTFVQQLKSTGVQLQPCYRVNTITGETLEFIPETRQEQTDRENREHCKRIAETLEAYVDGSVYRCPHCDEEITWSNARYDDETNAYTCQHCGQEFDADELEALDLYDYLADALDIDYTVNGSDRDTVKSVRVMVAFGGPNIYIDSASRAVELYWWTDRASYPISSSAADALDEWAQEIWTCC